MWEKGFFAVFGGIPIDAGGFIIGFANPKGIEAFSQGCEARATLGEKREKSQPCKG